MKRKFYLITNSSGCTYWSYKVEITAMSFVAPLLARAVNKHGTIFVNRKGGWFPKACAVHVLDIVEQEDFPSTERESV